MGKTLMNRTKQGFTVFVVAIVTAVGWHRAWSEEPAAPPETKAHTKANTNSPQDSESKVLFDWHDGRVKLEVAGLTGLHSGRRHRVGDRAVRTTVEYEIPLVKHLTVGGRVMPFMFWNENGEGEGDIFAFGTGVAFRAYSNGEEFRGWYGEIGSMLIGQTAHFEGNHGTFDFMEEAGAGYMFKSGWHVGAKIQHISNAGLSSKNSGVNGVGFAFGYTFKRHRSGTNAN